MELAVEKQAENAIKWIRALLSGEYEQGKNWLCSHDEKYCCWGVGRKILNLPILVDEDQWDKHYHNTEQLYWHVGFVNPSSLLEIPIMVNGIKSQCLANANDHSSGLFTFEVIGNYLIKNAMYCFVDGVHQIIREEFKDFKIKEYG